MRSYTTKFDWFNKNKDILGIEGIFKDIVKYAEYYYIIYKQDIKSVDAKIRNSVREFRYILSEMPAPLFMELYLCFLKNYIFYPHSAKSTALSSTASLLLHGSRNGWEYWLLESGKPIKSSNVLKKKFN